MRLLFIPEGGAAVEPTQLSHTGSAVLGP